MWAGRANPDPSCERGQAQVEYVLGIALIAFACILGIAFLRGTIDNVYGSTTRPLSSPLVRPVGYAVPTTLAECTDDGWRSYPQFTSEAECREFVISSAPDTRCLRTRLPASDLPMRRRQHPSLGRTWARLDSNIPARGLFRE